jgi:hypothetical protein
MNTTNALAPAKTLAITRPHLGSPNQRRFKGRGTNLANDEVERAPKLGTPAFQTGPFEPGPFLRN